MDKREYAMKRLASDLRGDDYSYGDGEDGYLMTGRGWNIERKEDGTLYLHFDDEIVSSEDFDLDPDMLEWVEELLSENE